MAFVLPGYFSPGGTTVITVPSEHITINMAPKIQAAMDAGKGNPVVVYMPGDVYSVWPESSSGFYPGNNCLEIRYSNVSLVGASRWGTVISCLAAGGKNPTGNWEVTKSGNTKLAWRGCGIGMTTGSALSNFSVRSLRLTGNTPRDLTKYPVTGVPTGQSFPASLVDGEGWDVTNKGIYLGNGTSRTNIRIEDCEIDSFRGELIYYGGSSGLQGLHIRSCSIHDSIASMVSTSGGMTLEDSELYRGENGVENTPLGDRQVIRRNWFHDNKQGVTFDSNVGPPSQYAGVEVRENRLDRHWVWSMAVLGSTRGVRIVDNDVSDSPNYGGVLLGAHGGGSGPADITIERNRFRSESQRTVNAVSINSDAGYPIKSVRVLNNRSESSRYAVAQGWPAPALNSAGNADSASELIASGNDFTG